MIPQGSYPGFTLTVTETSQGEQYVLVEWLDAHGRALCGQRLYSEALTSVGFVKIVVSR